MPKTSGFGWHKKFQDGFTNFKDGFHPGHPKTIVTNVNTASVVGLIDLQWKLLLIVLTYHKILTQPLKLRKVCARCDPIAWLKNKKVTSMKMPIFKKKCQIGDKSRKSELLNGTWWVNRLWVEELSKCAWLKGEMSYVYCCWDLAAQIILTYITFREICSADKISTKLAKAIFKPSRSWWE